MFSDLACRSLRSMLCSLEDNKNPGKDLIWISDKSPEIKFINDNGAAFVTNDQLNRSFHVHIAWLVQRTELSPLNLLHLQNGTWDAKDKSC